MIHKTPNRIHHPFTDQTVDELLKIFGTNQNTGLSQAEVQSRLTRYGYNEFPEKKASYLLKFLKKFWGITAWMLELIIALSWILHRFTDLFIVTLLLIINAIVSFIQELLASNAVESLRRKLYVSSRVLREGTWSIVAAKELVPGDIISITTGDFVPADIKIITGSLEVDQSALTGESLTIEKKRDDFVFSGSVIRLGEARGLVISTGTKTYYGKTIELVQVAAPQPHIELIVSQITKRLLGIVACAICIAVALSLKQGVALIEILPLMLVLLLGAIPVALPAMFTISMALGSQALSKKNALVIRLNTIEDAATMTILCVDKTGTLTMNQLAIVQVIALGNYSEDDVILYGALASNEETLEPIELAFTTAAKQKNLPVSAFTIKEFIPFEQTTKKTEVLVQRNEQMFRIYKGALGLMIKRLGLSGSEGLMLTKHAEEFAKKGLRTIAVAKSTNNNTPELVGLAGLEDLPRPESKQVLKELTNLGLAIKMITGDGLPIAQEIAREIGLGGNALSFSAEALPIAEAIKKNTIFAEINPKDKYVIVKTLQENGQIVGMTGDGVNDAPALQQAEVGIAVSNATDAAKKAASVVLTQPGLYPIKELITVGRLVFQRVHTWTVNKISRTVLKTGFIVIAFLLTGRYVIASSEILLLIFMTDFIKLSLATDNEQISKRPCFWNIPALTHLGLMLGIIMVIESLGLLYIGIKYLHLPEYALHSFSFEILFYFAILSVFVIREKEHFWHSMPSKLLLLTISIDTLIAFLITTYGLLGFAVIPIKYTFFVIGYAVIFSLIVNDRIKLFLLAHERSYSQ